MPSGLRAGQVFDGRTSVGAATVVIADGRVVAVERGTDLAGVEVTDLGDDVTLLPGLVDAHVHLGLDCSTDLLAGMAVGDEELLARMRRSAQAALAAGITTVRDLGDRGFLTRRLAAEVSGPTLLASGPPLTTPGGHCWFLGGEVDGLPAMLQAVGERAERGCDTVKVMVSGGNITPGSSPFEPQFRLAELREVVREAHRLGLRAAAHVHAPLCVSEALDAGFDSLEHATFMTPGGVEADPELLRRIAASGVTVSVTAGKLPGGVPPPAVASRLAAIGEVMAALHDLGARMVASSDGGIGPPKPHQVLPHALVEVVGLGLEPVEALRAVTSAPADSLGLGGRKGVLAAGAEADLLAVRGDPTRDVTAVHDVVGVWTGGRAVRR